MLKGKYFCITGKSSRKTKISVVMNLNVSADDIKTFNNGQVLSNFQDVKYLGQQKSIISKSESVDFFTLCSVPNKVLVEVT